MRRLSLVLATALVAATASPPSAMADRNSDAVVGAILGVMVAAAAARNRNNHRFDYSTDTAFYPADLPGTTCYTRARTCYQRGNYSPWATQRVFG
jgi:hypothetical protein